MPLIARFTIKGHSMEPNLHENDNVLISNIPYFFSKPKIGDVIAFRENKKILVKRIAGEKNKEYKVSGDNLSDSRDSRIFGWIGKNDIIGKVVYKLKVQS